MNTQRKLPGKSGKSGPTSPTGKSGKSGPTSPSCGKSGKSNGGSGKYYSCDYVILLVVGVVVLFLPTILLFHLSSNNIQLSVLPTSLCLLITIGGDCAPTSCVAIFDPCATGKSGKSNGGGGKSGKSNGNGGSCGKSGKSNGSNPTDCTQAPTSAPTICVTTETLDTPAPSVPIFIVETTEPTPEPTPEPTIPVTTGNSETVGKETVSENSETVGKETVSEEQTPWRGE